MDRRVTPPRRVTSPIWGKSRVLRLLSPSCKPGDLRCVKVLFHAFSVKSDQGSPRRPKGIPVYVMFPVPPSLVMTQVKEKPLADSKMAAYQEFLKHIYWNFMESGFSCLPGMLTQVYLRSYPFTHVYFFFIHVLPRLPMFTPAYTFNPVYPCLPQFFHVVPRGNQSCLKQFGERFSEKCERENPDR